MAASQKTVDDFIQLHQRHALTQAVRTAVELGILTSLKTGQQTADQLSEQLQLQPGPLERLMKVLVQTELVEQYGDDYALSPLARLIPEAYQDFGDRYWKNLSAHIKAGEPAPASPPRDVQPTPAESNRDYLQQKSAEEWLLTPIAMDAALVLDVGRSRRGLRVLEIGAGSAVFSAALAHRDPDSVINLLDTAEGLQRSRQTIESIGLERQSELIEVPNLENLATLPALQNQQYDLVLLAGVLHRMEKEAAFALLSQLKLFIAPDRELAIIEVFPGQEKGDCARAIFGLELTLRTESGSLLEPTDLKEQLRQLGFSNIQYAHLPSPPHYWGLMVAQQGH